MSTKQIMRTAAVALATIYVANNVTPVRKLVYGA
jgi:hypothetical protein